MNCIFETNTYSVKISTARKVSGNNLGTFTSNLSAETSSRAITRLRSTIEFIMKTPIGNEGQ